MKILVTGSEGFIGKNLCLALQRIPDAVILKYDINNSKNDLEKFLTDADLIYHLAGVNRPEKINDYDDNSEFTSYICEYLIKIGRPTPFIFSSSIQTLLDNKYGETKKRAENIILEYGKKLDTNVYIYRFPNIFGKWSRPNYNTVVATFCYNITHGIDIKVSDKNKIVEFVYINDVVGSMIDKLMPTKHSSTSYYEDYPTYKISLGDLADTIKSFKEIRNTLQINDLSNTLTKYLYSTYLSFYDPDNLAYQLEKKIDDRGWLFELIKSKHIGQIFISKTKPGITRGNHYHDTKIEKFCVIHGKGIIRLRHMINNSIIEYAVSEDTIQIVDIPPGYTHSITNTGDSDMITIFWSNEIFDPNNLDTYFSEV